MFTLSPELNSALNKDAIPFGYVVYLARQAVLQQNHPQSHALPDNGKAKVTLGENGTLDIKVYNAKG